MLSKINLRYKYKIFEYVLNNILDKSYMYFNTAYHWVYLILKFNDYIYDLQGQHIG